MISEPATTSSPQGGTLDIAESLRQAERVHALPKNCWWNALDALRGDPATRDCCYVEGMIAYSDLLAFTFQHGWLERPDGTVIDPTAVGLRDGEVVAGLVQVRYYPAIRYTRQQAIAGKYHKRETMPVTPWHKHTGWRRAEYTAMLAAFGGPGGATPAQVAELRRMDRMDQLDAMEAAQAARGDATEEGA